MSASDVPLFSLPRTERGANPAGEIAADARNVETLLLRTLADVGQVQVAARAGISDTRLSRFKNAAQDGGGLQLPEVAAVIAAMGLAVIDTRPSDVVSMPTAEVEALRTLARKALGGAA